MKWRKNFDMYTKHLEQDERKMPSSDTRDHEGIS